MFNPERILGQLLTSGMGTGRRRGAGLGGFGTASLGMGLLGVAVAAFEHYSEKNSSTTAAPPPAPGSAGMSPPPPPSATAAAVPHQPPPPPRWTTESPQPPAPALVVLRVMIAAANADGVIDADERRTILQHAGTHLSSEDQQGLMQELDHPQSLDTLLPLIDTALTIDCYTAALLAITVDSPQERHFLDKLATSTKLDETVRQRIHQQLEVNK